MFRDHCQYASDAVVEKRKAARFWLMAVSLKAMLAMPESVSPIQMRSAGDEVLTKDVARASQIYVPFAAKEPVLLFEAIPLELDALDAVVADNLVVDVAEAALTTAPAV